MNAASDPPLGLRLCPGGVGIDDGGPAKDGSEEAAKSSSRRSSALAAQKQAAVREVRGAEAEPASGVGLAPELVRALEDVRCDRRDDDGAEEAREHEVLERQERREDVDDALVKHGDGFGEDVADDAAVDEREHCARDAQGRLQRRDQDLVVLSAEGACQQRRVRRELLFDHLHLRDDVVHV
eukprot:CAMPEP_0174870452 /NCGR_PEP_ID=MMETSP1114-20130205/69736_1 /TAXON_ID=312471 /ORGANISM="Neobodo designis, Strain CCAP 1951/1" /LENGTH=181 /DNA_ID=CAMNT_0016105719 /DNA_START=100 /DNA_END=641 /DNA_ORIENTATION=+